MKKIKLIGNSVSKGIFIGLGVVITLFSVYAWQSTTTNDSVDNNLKADTNDTLTLDKWNGLVQRVSGIETANNGDVKIGQLAGSSNRCVYADSNGILHVKGDDCGSAGASGDNLGNHTATQNIDLNGNKIVNGGNSGISVSSGGKVGIGTSSPSNLLTVEGGTFALNNLGHSVRAVFNPSSSNYLSIEAFNSDNTAKYPIALNAWGGNVGIGTSSPGSKLDINGGTLRVTRNLGATPSSNPDATVLASFRNGNKSSDQRVLDIGVNSDNSAYIRSVGTNLSIFGGKVGIGTNSPSYKLHVLGNIYAQNGWIRTSGNTGWYNNTYGGGWNMIDDMRIRTYGNKSIYQNTGVLRTDGIFQVGPNGNRFIVNSNGNVSIGSTSTPAKLYVTHDSTGTTAIITGQGSSTYKSDWPNGRSGGLATRDIVGSSAYFSNYTTRSDRRLKKEITPLDQEKIDNLLKLNPVSFKWKDTKIDNEKHFGFIAQEVKPLFGNLVTTAKNKEKTMSIRYSEFIPVMVETIQQQQKQIEELKNEIEKLKNQ